MEATDVYLSGVVVGSLSFLSVFVVIPSYYAISVKDLQSRLPLFLILVTECRSLSLLIWCSNLLTQVEEGSTIDQIICWESEIVQMWAVFSIIFWLFTIVIYVWLKVYRPTSPLPSERFLLILWLSTSILMSIVCAFAKKYLLSSMWCEYFSRFESITLTPLLPIIIVVLFSVIYKIFWSRAHRDSRRILLSDQHDSSHRRRVFYTLAVFPLACCCFSLLESVISVLQGYNFFAEGVEHFIVSEMNVVIITFCPLFLVCLYIFSYRSDLYILCCSRQIKTETSRPLLQEYEITLRTSQDLVMDPQ